MEVRTVTDVYGVSLLLVSTLWFVGCSEIEPDPPLAAASSESQDASTPEGSYCFSPSWEICYRDATRLPASLLGEAGQGCPGERRVSQCPEGYLASCQLGEGDYYVYKQRSLRESMQSCPSEAADYRQTPLPTRIASSGFSQQPPQRFYHWCVTQSENSPALCQIIDYFSEPHILYGCFELLNDFSDIAHRLDLKFWLEGGTLLGQARFNAPNPWDDDVDLGVFKNELVAVFPRLKREIEAKGYTLSQGCLAPRRSDVGICQVYYAQEKFLAMLATSVPTMTSLQREEVWLAYNSNSTQYVNRGLPHLDIFTYLEREESIVYDSQAWADDLHQRIGREGFTRKSFLPLVPYSFAGAIAYLPKEPAFYTEAWYETTDLYRSVYIWGHRKGGTKLDDISAAPDLVAYFKAYLEHVFKTSLHFSPLYEALLAEHGAAQG